MKGIQKGSLVISFFILISGFLIANIQLSESQNLENENRTPINSDSQQPRIKNLVKPVYPVEAKRAEKEGIVIIQATINVEGIPQDIVAVTKLGYGFEAAAIGSMKKSTFYPATKDGKPVPITVRMPYEFKLDNTDSDMVLIPSGEFQMGNNNADTDEKPVHSVFIDAFKIDIYEVTNAQYKEFVDANPEWGKDKIPRAYHDGYYLIHWNGNNYPTGKMHHPVVYVSWYAAMAYAEWVGKRLPTEAEWEKAARGGLVDKMFPWGDSIEPTNANYFMDTVGGTTPVGSYFPNEYGLYDMAGNVREWCLDTYEPTFYVNSPKEKPIAGAENIDDVINDFINIKDTRVLRGGSWLNIPEKLRVSDRSSRLPTGTNPNDGFRCVKQIETIPEFP